MIERQVGQLVRLVDDLLDVSRITANKMMLRREPHELARLMATAVESIMPLATAAEHTLDVELPPTPVLVDGDGARLVQVFANVLNNAVKFTPPGGHIWFTAEGQSDEVVVRIRDTGIGIAADVLPRVFDMFHQAEPILERSTGGLGIGLTLARRLVEMHEGRIDIRSPGAGQGTEVEIRLPTTPVRRDTRWRRNRRRSRPTRSLRVLIVEDNLDAAEMLDVAVSQLGHATRLAHDGAAAISIATAVRARRDPPGHRPAGNERLCGRASVAGTAGVRSRAYRRRHRLGAGRGSSKSARRRVRQPLHQASFAGRAGRASCDDPAEHAIRTRVDTGAANDPRRLRPRFGEGGGLTAPLLPEPQGNHPAILLRTNSVVLTGCRLGRCVTATHSSRPIGVNTITSLSGAPGMER